jgi:hypothetical protein
MPTPTAAGGRCLASLPRRKSNSASPTSADLRRRVQRRTRVQAAPSRAASFPPSTADPLPSQPTTRTTRYCAGNQTNRLTQIHTKRAKQSNAYGANG